MRRSRARAEWSWAGCDPPQKLRHCKQQKPSGFENQWDPSSKANRPKNDNNLIIVRRTPGYFLFLWYCVLLIRRRHTCETLEDLYFGNITPNDQIVKSGTALKKAMEQSAECEEKLTALLEDKEKALLLRLINAENEIGSTMALENFILGFRLGVRMILEALDEDDGSLIDQNKEE